MTLSKGGGGTRSSKNRFDSCSSRITAHADKFDAHVDNVNIEEFEHGSSDDAASLPDREDDTGIFSIANDCSSEEVNSLAEEEKNLLAVLTKRT